MGNQNSSATQKKSSGLFKGDTTSAQSKPASTPQQDNSDQFSKKKTQRPKFSLAIRGRNRSPSGSTTPSARTSGSTTLRQHSAGTDGASTPKEDLPAKTAETAPTMATVQKGPGSIQPASSSEASTITPGILQNTGSPPPAPTVAPTLVPLPALSMLEEESEAHSSSRAISPSSPSDQQTSSSRPMSPNPIQFGQTRPLTPWAFGDIVVPAPPLGRLHFCCHHDHQRMMASQNVKCPVPCQTCKNDDHCTRWRCQWCYLRICGSCMQALAKIERRDLATFMKQLEEKENAKREKEANAKREKEANAKREEAAANRNFTWSPSEVASMD
ncbi:MAG: hypothetical protein Q9174_003511 [Haloplaca sp. 1 TL-2023]